MKLSLFDYDLPRHLIAQYPSRRRADSRMLVLDRSTGEITDGRFRDFPELVRQNYFLVINDSKVFKARLYARRRSGGKVEVFLIRRSDDDTWVAFLRPSGRIKAGEKLYFDSKRYLTVLDQPGSIERAVSFPSQVEEEYIIARHGRIPLPPYIRRSPEKQDTQRYQTIYARNTGSVAAPTAGLHFDRRLMAELETKGVPVEWITLHVGPGTFKPVTTEEVEGHYVDPEFVQITSETAKAIESHRLAGKKLLAVGTTTVRSLEFAAFEESLPLDGYQGMVDLFIYPPYKFRVVEALLTNFHLPKSSLLMLVSAFCSRELILKAYRRAIEREYRFYSYGDCMLIL